LARTRRRPKGVVLDLVLICALRRIGLANTRLARASWRHHPPQAVQDRRTHQHPGAPHQACHEFRLSVPARMAPDICQARGSRLSALPPLPVNSKDIAEPQQQLRAVITRACNSRARKIAATDLRPKTV
jgi:hypothetical protein